MRLRPIPAERSLESLSEGGARCEPEFLGGLRDVGARIPDIAWSRLGVFRTNRDAEDFRQEPGHLIDRSGGSGAHVDDLSRDRSFPRQLQGRREVSDVQEVPRLSAVSVDFDSLVRRYGHAEFCDDARIWRCRVLSRSVYV